MAIAGDNKNGQNHGMQRSGGGPVSREIKVDSRRPLIPDVPRLKDGQSKSIRATLRNHSAKRASLQRTDWSHHIVAIGFDRRIDTISGVLRSRKRN